MVNMLLVYALFLMGFQHASSATGRRARKNWRITMEDINPPHSLTDWQQFQDTSLRMLDLCNLPGDQKKSIQKIIISSPDGKHVEKDIYQKIVGETMNRFLSYLDTKEDASFVQVLSNIITESFGNDIRIAIRITSPTILCTTVLQTVHYHKDHMVNVLKELVRDVELKLIIDSFDGIIDEVEDAVEQAILNALSEEQFHKNLGFQRRPDRVEEPKSLWEEDERDVDDLIDFIEGETLIKKKKKKPKEKNPALNPSEKTPSDESETVCNDEIEYETRMKVFYDSVTSDSDDEGGWSLVSSTKLKHQKVTSDEDKIRAAKQKRVKDPQRRSHAAKRYRERIEGTEYDIPAVWERQFLRARELGKWERVYWRTIKPPGKEDKTLRWKFIGDDKKEVFKVTYKDLVLILMDTKESDELIVKTMWLKQ